MNKPRRKPGTAGYYRGAVDALKVLYHTQGQVTPEYRAIADCFPLAELIHSAKRTGQLRTCGLREYERAYVKATLHDQAEAMGYDAGLNGDTSDNKPSIAYWPESALQAWSTGFERGERERLRHSQGDK